MSLVALVPKRRCAPIVTLSTATASCRVCCAMFQAATCRLPYSVGNTASRYCSRRSASLRWSIPTRTWQSPGRRPRKVSATYSPIRLRYRWRSAPRPWSRAPRWFQLYWSSDDEFVRSLVSRAERCGAEAIVVTLDTTLLGWRPRDLDLGYLPFLRGLGLAQYLSDEVFRRKIPSTPPQTGFRPRGLNILSTALSLRRKGKQFGLSMGQMRAAVAHFTATYSRPDLNWSDIARLRAMTRLPILLKGVRHAEDAGLAQKHGVNGIVVSNHGGRQVDGETATLDALPAIAKAAGDMTVLLDSGIRSGADVAKALALGRACGPARQALRLRSCCCRRGRRARSDPQCRRGNSTSRWHYAG